MPGRVYLPHHKLSVACRSRTPQNVFWAERGMQPRAPHFLKSPWVLSDMPSLRCRAWGWRWPALPRRTAARQRLHTSQEMSRQVGLPATIVCAQQYI